MSGAVTVVGGVYAERCVWPGWDQVYGSGGRAAVAMSGNVGPVTLATGASESSLRRFAPFATLNGVTLDAAPAAQTISFDYLHTMAVPEIWPSLGRLDRLEGLRVDAERVLRFGMLEATAVVKARRCVYDLQSAFAPEDFRANGSTAEALAIVANRAEVATLTGNPDPLLGAAQMAEGGGADVVVVKAGALGAFVVRPGRDVVRVPPYRSDMVFTLGSGDVFAATFCAAWGVEGRDPAEAADLASRSVSEYVGSMALPCRPLDTLAAGTHRDATAVRGSVYLAGPFFTIAQRWLVDEVRRCLTELGQSVFSPVHDIGPGPAHVVAPADIEALTRCDAVFALADGLDSGSIFEVGYARALGKPVHVLAQQVSAEDLKMIEGTGCRVYTDLVTAMHHLAWRA